MNFVVIVPVIATFVFSLSSVGSRIHGRIFNGQNADSSQFKFMAVVRITKLYSSTQNKVALCGGTIIGPNWILTAAHCVEGGIKFALFLGTSSTHNSETGYEVKIEEVVSHSDWDKDSKTNDMAVMRTPTIEECSLVGYARLPFRWINSPLNTLSGKKAIAIGWGYTGKAEDEPDQLQWTRMAIMSSVECANFIAFLTDGDLCGDTSSPYGSTCPGDSGGPLVLEETGELIGVTSFSVGAHCEEGKPVIFMRVAYFLSWITEVTGIHQ